MIRLVSLALLAISLSAQGIPSGQDQELSRAAKNPYDLARYIDSHLGFDWGVMWRVLGAEPVFIQPCGKLSDGKKRCSTELITVLDPDQIVLVIQGDATPADVYVRFLQEKTGTWRFAGTFEAFIHNHPRRHEVDRSTGQPFLRVSSQGLRGSDVDSEIEDWFDLTQPGFEPIFSFPVEGHQQPVGFGISRRIVGTINTKQDEIDVTLQVHFSATNSEHDLSLGVGWYSGAYTRAKGAKQFSLQNAYEGFGRQLKMLLTEFEALADLDEGPSDEDLIHYAMAGLKDLASGRDSAAKNWIKQFLTKVRDTPEVRELKALLR
jgi:hypothetical protein